MPNTYSVDSDVEHWGPHLQPQLLGKLKQDRNFKARLGLYSETPSSFIPSHQNIFNRFRR